MEILMGICMGMLKIMGIVVMARSSRWLNSRSLPAINILIMLMSMEMEMVMVCMLTLITAMPTTTATMHNIQDL